MMEDELPEGWSRVNIASLIPKDGLFNDGDWVESKDQDENGDVRLIQLADIGVGEFRDKSSKFLTSAKAKKLNCTFLTEGDILIARMPDPLGRACLFPLPGKHVTVVDVAIIRCGENGISGKWLMHILNSPDAQRKINELASGSTRMRISRKNLASIEIPLPPLAEQSRIVAKLDAAFRHLETLKMGLARIPELLKKFRQTVLTQAVTGKLTENWREENTGVENARVLLERMQLERSKYFKEKLEIYKSQNEKRPKAINELLLYTEHYEFPETWQVIEPEHLTSISEYSLGIGPFGSDLKVTDYTSEGVPLIFVRHIKANNFKGLNPQFVSEEKAIKLFAHNVKPNDLLITKMGEPPGDCEIYPSERPYGIITADCIRLRVWSDYFNNIFIKYCTNSSFIKNQLGLITKGVAQQKISLERFKTLHFPVPPLEEQQEIVSRVEALFAQADAIEAQYQSLKAKIDKLPQALLDKAFRGELVPQDLMDEPASVLLEKIKAATAAVSKKGRKTGQTKLVFMEE